VKKKKKKPKGNQKSRLTEIFEIPYRTFPPAPLSR